MDIGQSVLSQLSWETLVVGSRRNRARASSRAASRPSLVTPGPHLWSSTDLPISAKCWPRLRWSSNHTQIIKIKLVLNAALNINVAMLIVDCSTHLSATLIVTSLDVSVVDKEMLGRLVRRNKKNFIQLVFNINIVNENIQVAVCSMWTVVLLCSQSCTSVTRHLGTTRDSWYWHKLCTAQCPRC